MDKKSKISDEELFEDEELFDEEEETEENEPQEQDDLLTDDEAAERAARKAEIREKRRKKKKRNKTIRNVLLIVLAVIVVLVGACVGIVMSMQKNNFAYDNITECSQATAAGSAGRFAFNAADGTMTVKLDKNDIWWAVYESGEVSKLEALDAKLAAKNTRLTGMGIVLDGDKFGVMAEITLFNKIRLPMQAPCTFELTDAGITVRVSEAQFANGWNVPLSALCKLYGATVEDLALSFSSSLHPILSDVRGIAVAEGKVVLTCGIDDSAYTAAAANAADAKRMLALGVDNAAVAALANEETGYNEAIAALEQDPTGFAAFRTGVLALAGDAASTEYLAGASSAYSQRFLPEVTLETVTAARQEMTGLETARAQLLSDLATNLNTAYVAGNVGAPEADKDSKDKDKETAAATATQLVNKSVDGKPALTMEQMAGANWAQYSEWLAETDMRAVYLTNFPNTVASATDAGEDGDSKKKSDDDDEKKSEETPATPIGLLVRMKDGSFRLYYCEAEKAAGADKATYTATYVLLSAEEGESYMALAHVPTIAYSAATMLKDEPAAPEIPVAPAAETETPAEASPTTAQ